MVAAIKAYFPRYPTRQAVTLPALHIVNERLRYVPLEGGRGNRRAARPGARPKCKTRCRSTASSSRTSRMGKTRAWVCRSISCALRGGEEVLEHLCHKAGVQPGETTPDGKLTLEFAECLGACEFAPCMLANQTLHKDLTAEKANVFLEQCRGGNGKHRAGNERE